MNVKWKSFDAWFFDFSARGRRDHALQAYRAGQAEMRERAAFRLLSTLDFLTHAPMIAGDIKQLPLEGDDAD